MELINNEKTQLDLKIKDLHKSFGSQKKAGNYTLKNYFLVDNKTDIDYVEVTLNGVIVEHIEERNFKNFWCLLRKREVTYSSFINMIHAYYINEDYFIEQQLKINNSDKVLIIRKD